MSKMPIHAMNPSRQQGAALLLSLVFLVVLTLLGVSAMQGTLLQERMAGNFRETQAAMDAAEAALRRAEAYLEQANIGPFDGSLPGLYSSSQCNDGGTPPLPVPCWQQAGLNWASITSGSWPVTPQYLIEELPAEPIPGSSLSTMNPLPSSKFYRITARGYSENGQSQVVLQSSFRRE